VEYKDYYRILGVAVDADQAAIKAAYRALARQHHPDIHPGDLAAEDRFKEINEAYQALGDVERRRTYDQQSQQRNSAGRSGGFARGDRQAQSNQSATSGMSSDDLRDLFGEEASFSDFFSSIYGREPAQERSSAPRRGRDSEASVAITLAEALHGTSRTLQIGERRIDARIPPGVRTGSRVRLTGQGSAGVMGGPAGDLYLEIEVQTDARFARDDDDLTTEVVIDLFTAAAGGEARVTTLDGVVVLKIPPRTPADRVFRLRRKGMPHVGNPSERGDLYARAKLVLPDALSDSELEALQTMQRARQPVAAERS
jgi:curved DNA-binding protein